MNILKITHASISFLQITRIQINDNLLFFLGKLNKYFVVILHNQLQKWHESHLRDNLLKVNHVNTLNCSNLIYIFCIAELRLEYKIRNRSGISFSIIQKAAETIFFHWFKQLIQKYKINIQIGEYQEVYFKKCSSQLKSNLIP